MKYYNFYDEKASDWFLMMIDLEEKEVLKLAAEFNSLKNYNGGFDEYLLSKGIDSKYVEVEAAIDIADAFIGEDGKYYYQDEEI